ncbi:hypothetical protein WJX72_011365 [[Myrmecia] bisecta]|uniref:DNA-directed RNA polymerase RBP11-like dimerisation domain-containing protein n=1 Tax=[Myrmecia] bisecta TaxID=41462 RepID=A0AAW1RAI3_9CHLO
MNAPDRYEKFVVPDGLKKVAYERDTKVPNAATFTLQREDHTMGNLIRMQLHRDKHVMFSGYKIPHPLEYRMLIKVQTDGSKTPIEAADGALKDLQDELNDIREQFVKEAERQQPEAMIF